MSELYPIHLMIKPEGLPYEGYINSQLDLLETITMSQPLFRLRTILTPQEVDLIYPEPNIPREFKEDLSKNPTEHRIILGDEGIFQEAKRVKGKMDTGGVRNYLLKITKENQFPLERWQNFLHTSENLLESQPVCSHFTNRLDICQECAAKSICFSSPKTK